MGRHAWQPPTWASVMAVSPLTRVRCSCRRTVTADMLFDLRAMPETPQDWGCDACRSRLMELERKLDPETYLRRLQAPAALLVDVAKRRTDRAAALVARAQALKERADAELRAKAAVVDATRADP